MSGFTDTSTVSDVIPVNETTGYIDNMMKTLSVPRNTYEHVKKSAKTAEEIKEIIEKHVNAELDAIRDAVQTELKAVLSQPDFKIDWQNGVGDFLVPDANLLNFDDSVVGRMIVAHSPYVSAAGTTVVHVDGAYKVVINLANAIRDRTMCY